MAAFINAHDVSLEPLFESLPTAGEQRPVLSIVCPLFNEAPAVAELLRRITEALATPDLSYEIVAVDDGSTDATLATLKDAMLAYPSLRVLELYRNYGQVAALGAGMSVARGRWILMIDGDLQHDPGDICRLIAAANEGHDLVATYRERREEPFSRLAVTWIGNHINRFLTGVDIGDFGSSYRLFDSCLLDMLTDMAGHVHYNTPALYINARSCIEIPITQQHRPHGTSKWDLNAFISYNLDFLARSKRITQLLLAIGIMGMVISGVLYLLSLADVLEGVRTVTTPMSIALVSLLIVLSAIVWREVMQTQRLARGEPPYLINGIWFGRDGQINHKPVALSGSYPRMYMRGCLNNKAATR
jgi:glycosyltransferase involved in cell wall biosynthesis